MAKKMKEPNEMKQKNYTSKDVEVILLGVMLCLIALIGALNSGPVGNFLFFCLGYVFGIFCFLPFLFLFIYGIYLIVKRRSFKAHIGKEFAGFLLLLFGFIIASSNSNTLTVKTMMAEFNRVTVGITPLQFDSFGQVIALGGGFIGYLCAALINSAITYIGGYIVSALLILGGVVLLAYNPIKLLVKKIKSSKESNKEEKKKNDKEIKRIPLRKEPVKVDEYNSIDDMSDDSSFLDNEVDYNTTLRASIKHPVITAEKAYFNPEDNSSLPQSPKKEVESLSDQKDDDFPISRKVDTPTTRPVVTPIVTPLVEAKKDEPHKEEELPQEEEDDLLEDDLINEEEETSPFDDSYTDYKDDFLEEGETLDDYQDVISYPSHHQEEKEDKDENKSTIPFSKNISTSVSNLVDDTFSHQDPVIHIKNDHRQVKEHVDNFSYPSLTLLNDYENENVANENYEASVVRQEKINDIFNDLDIGAQVSGFTIGPTVTRFEIKTNPNVSVNTVSKYIDDVAVRLGGVNARFEKVVTGLSTSGLEIPNKKSTMVSFKECIGPYMNDPKYKYFVPLGKNITGDIIGFKIIDLPHLLVAGSTGSGKSIFIHNLIMSLIMKANPSELKLILIDPKYVEMNKYKEIPHLLCPVITDALKAKVALYKMVKETDRRYQLIAEAGVSKMEQYNEYAREHGLKEEPFIIIVIDEYADLIEYCKEISVPVVRIAQKARAAGISLVISTQRPSVNVITGVIKANLSSRVALRVASYVDSQTILGEGGAEKLLGHGDLLVDSPEIKGVGFTRLQCPYVDNNEIREVCNYLRRTQTVQYDPNYLDLTEKKSTSFMNEDGEEMVDERYDEVIEYISTLDAVSANMIQNNFRFGVNRSGRIYNQLKKDGYIEQGGTGPHFRSKVLKRKDNK